MTMFWWVFGFLVWSLACFIAGARFWDERKVSILSHLREFIDRLWSSVAARFDRLFGRTDRLKARLIEVEARTEGYYIDIVQQLDAELGELER